MVLLRSTVAQAPASHRLWLPCTQPFFVAALHPKVVVAALHPTSLAMASEAGASSTTPTSCKKRRVTKGKAEAVQEDFLRLQEQKTVEYINEYMVEHPEVVPVLASMCQNGSSLQTTPAPVTNQDELPRSYTKMKNLPVKFMSLQLQEAEQDSDLSAYLKDSGDTKKLFYWAFGVAAEEMLANGRGERTVQVAPHCVCLRVPPSLSLPLSLSVALFACLCGCLSFCVCLSVHQSVSLSVSACLSLCQSVFLSLSLSVFLPVFPSVSVSLSVFLCVCQSLCVSLSDLSVFLSLPLSLPLSLSLSLRQSAGLSVRLSVFLR